MIDEEPVEMLSDIGQSSEFPRRRSTVGANVVARLKPDDSLGHVQADERIRQLLEQHYSDSIDRLAEDDERVVIERLVFRSDDLPYIEYRLVEE